MPYILTLLMFLAFIAGLSLALLSIAYGKLKKDLVKQRENIEEYATDKARETITDASYSAQKIYEKANLRAQEIIRNADLFAGDERKEFHEELEAAVRKELGSFGDMLANLRGQTKSSIESIVVETKNETSKYIETFVKGLGAELAETKTTIRSKIERELANYKEDRIKDIEEDVDRIVGKVAKEVLGRTLSKKDRREAVILALKKAKEEKVV